MAQIGISCRALVRHALFLALGLLSTSGPARADGGPETVARQPPVHVSAACTPALFGAPVPHKLLEEGGLFGLVLSDFNRDGFLDAAAGTFGESLFVLPGTSDGTFGLPREYVFEAYITAYVVADFNRDGNPDLAVAHFDHDPLVVLLGDGAFGFNAAGAVDVPPPRSLVAGNFNGDTLVDLVVATQDPDLFDWQLMLLPGNGAGGFGTAIPLSSGSSASWLAAADFNGDGRLDLAAALYDPGVPVGVMEIRLASATGGFDAPASYPLGPGYAESGVIADINSDGRLDIATTHYQNTVAVLLGDAAGNFGPPSLISLEWMPVGIAAVDFTGDGRVDLAVSYTRPDHPAPDGWARYEAMVAILEGDGTGGFGSHTAFPTIGDQGRYLSAGDVDRDGQIDLVAATSRHELGSGGFVSLARNMCGDTVDLSVHITESGDPVLAAADLTYTITVTNAGPDPSDVLVRTAVPANARFRSASVSDGVCLADYPKPTLPDYFVNCTLRRVTGTPPGNTATVTIIVSPDTSGLFTISTTAIIGGTDGVPSNNSAIETTTVRTLGGAQIAIAAAAGGGTALTWRGGDAQAGYYIGRLAGGTASVLPTSGTPLPATATAFVDPDPIPGQANCYAVAPVDTVGPLGRSALVCQIPDTASASGAPSAFTLRFSNGEALLTWSGPGAQTGYALGIYPQDGSTPRYRRMPWTAAREAVTIPTCFVVVAETASTVLGHSNFLCAVPGVGTIPEPLP